MVSTISESYPSLHGLLVTALPRSVTASVLRLAAVPWPPMLTCPYLRAGLSLYFNWPLGDSRSSQKIFQVDMMRYLIRPALP